MKIEVTHLPVIDDDELIISNTRKYNSLYLPNEFEPISVYVRDSENNLLGGLTGKTVWNWLHIEFLWVDRDVRGTGLGDKIVLEAEVEAQSRGCIGSTLDTFSFQAPECYRKMGYSEFGKLSEYEGNNERHFMRKIFKR